MTRGTEPDEFTAAARSALLARDRLNCPDQLVRVTYGSGRAPHDRFARPHGTARRQLLRSRISASAVQSSCRFARPPDSSPWSRLLAAIATAAAFNVAAAISAEARAALLAPGSDHEIDRLVGREDSRSRCGMRAIVVD